MQSSGGSRLFKEQTDRRCGHERPARTSHERQERWLDVHAPRAYSLHVTRLTPPGFCILRFRRRIPTQHDTVSEGRVGPSHVTPSSSTRRYHCFGHDTVCHTRDSERICGCKSESQTEHSNNKTQQHITRLLAWRPTATTRHSNTHHEAEA
jgi:hypothetical protein